MRLDHNPNCFFDLNNNHLVEKNISIKNTSNEKAITIQEAVDCKAHQVLQSVRTKEVDLTDTVAVVAGIAEAAVAGE